MASTDSIDVVAELRDGQHWKFTPGAHLLKASFQVLDCGEDLSRRDPETGRRAVFLGHHFTKSEACLLILDVLTHAIASAHCCGLWRPRVWKTRLL